MFKLTLAPAASKKTAAAGFIFVLRGGAQHYKYIY